MGFGGKSITTFMSNTPQFARIDHNDIDAWKDLIISDIFSYSK